MKIEVLVQGKNRYGEYPVKVRIDGKIDEDKTYFASDKQDANETARAMVYSLGFAHLTAVVTVKYAK